MFVLSRSDIIGEIMDFDLDHVIPVFVGRIIRTFSLISLDKKFPKLKYKGQARPLIIRPEQVGCSDF